MIFSSSPERSGRRRNSSTPSTTSTSRENRSDRPLQRLRPEEYSRNRGALAVALRVGPHRGHPAAGLRDPGGHPQEEGGPRARPSGRRCRLPDGDPSQIQHSPARGLADPDDRLQRDDESRDNRELAQEVLADLWGADETIIPIELIQRKTAECFG